MLHKFCNGEMNHKQKSDNTNIVIKTYVRVLNSTGIKINRLFSKKMVNNQTSSETLRQTKNILMIESDLFND
jgi:D-hexose-6-phosphate mutarotase